MVICRALSTIESTRTAQRYCDWDWSNAEREFLRALELNPQYVLGLDRYGVWFLQGVGG